MDIITILAVITGALVLILVGSINLIRALVLHFDKTNAFSLEMVKDNFKLLKHTYDLQNIKGCSRKYTPLTGDIEGNCITITLVKKVREYFYRILLNLPKPKSFAVIIKKKEHRLYKLGYYDPFVSSMVKAGYKEVTVFDPAHLKEVDIYAKEEVAAAGMLNEATRKSINLIINAVFDIYVSENEIELLIKTGNIDISGLKKIIRQLCRLSSQLETGKNIYNLILHNAEHDSVPKVREDNLRLLVRDYGNKAQTKEILKKALTDPDFNVNMFATETLGINKAEHLIYVINNLHPSEKVKAIRMIGRERMRHCLDFLLDYIKTIGNNYVKIETMKIFKLFRELRANELLIPELESDFSEIRQAAIEALAFCGKINAVPALYKIAQDPTALDYLRRKANYAISSIQSRIGDKGEGWLSLAELSPGEGSLSVTKDIKVGGLSLADSKTQKKKLKNE